MWSFVGKAKEKVWVSFRQRFTRGIGSSEMQKGHEHYGIHSRCYIVNVRCVIPISGKLARKCSPVNDIRLLGKRVGLLIILSDLTIR